MGDSRPHLGITNPAEWKLVALVIAFANQAPPESPRRVERHFKGHPFVAPRLWKSMPDEDASVAAFRDDHAQLRKVLREVVKTTVDWRAERSRLEQLLTKDLTVPAQIADETLQLSLGRPVVKAAADGINFGFEPYLTGVQAAIWYGLVLLLDPRRDLQRGFVMCRCEKFFWRTRGQRYCSAACSEAAKRDANVRRVQKWRERHPDWYEEGKQQRRPTKSRPARRGRR